MDRYGAIWNRCPGGLSEDAASRHGAQKDGQPCASSALILTAAVVFGGLGFASEAQADPRRFGFVYESTTMTSGEVEFEQWVTWKTNKGTDSTYDRLDIRHEIEFGVTDRFQLAFYLSDWRYQDGLSVEDDGAEWRDFAVEGIYNLKNPVTDLFGLALYGEVKVGEEFFELEGKLIIDKNFGQIVGAYNATIEAEWEGSSFHEDKGKFQQTLGLSYELAPQWSIGAELLHEVGFPDWDDTSDHRLYIGPNFSHRQDHWFVTVTPLFQVTDVDSAVDVQVRLLFGVTF